VSDRRLEPPASDTPADLLGPAWELLDALPRSAAPASLMTTTIEMAAARPRPAPAAWWRSWIAPVAVVATAFAVGVAAGRGSGTDADQFVFDHMPVLEHYDVVREAGSVEFLMAIAQRNYPPPRRPFTRNGAAAPPVYAALDAAVAAFTTEPVGAGFPGAAERRKDFSSRPVEERRRVADAAGSFQRLTATERRDLVRLARAFGGRDGEGPDREELLAAARLWHQWLATRDPADRRAVIELDTAERLEWLDYALARSGPGRGGAFRDGGGFRGFPPPGPPPGSPPLNGPRFNGRPPFDPRPRPPIPRETPAAPR
jgi:hypothetical protein